MSGNAPFSLRPLAPADADAVKQLWSARFGGDPSTQENWIEAALTPSHSAVGCVAVASSTDEVVGLAFLDVAGRDYTRRYLGLPTLDLHPPLADRNGIFHLYCVRKEWEGRGIGSAFYERCLDELADRHVPRAFGIAWHRPHTVDSRVLFEKYDFECLTTVEEYYSRTGSRPHCPDCSGPCSCTASLFAHTMATN